MKTQKIVTIILMTIALASCKSDKKDDKPANDSELKKEENSFNVTFNLIVKKDDNFHLYYTEDKSINFNEDQSVWLPIKGSENEQEVKFILPEDIIPTDIRVDFGYGVNKEQSEISLKKFRMNYYDKSFEVKDSLIFNYFYPNKDNTILDKTKATLKRVNLEQTTGPSLYPHITLTEEISKMVK